MTHDLKTIRARAKEFRERLADHPDVERFFGAELGEPTETEFLLAEIDRLRQGLWDCARISGADVEDDTPASLAYPDIVDYAKQEVQQLRDDYNEAIQECSVESHS